MRTGRQPWRGKQERSCLRSRRASCACGLRSSKARPKCVRRRKRLGGASHATGLARCCAMRGAWDQTAPGSRLQACTRRTRTSRRWALRRRTPCSMSTWLGCVRNQLPRQLPERGRRRRMQSGIGITGGQALMRNGSDLIGTENPKRQRRILKGMTALMTRRRTARARRSTRARTASAIAHAISTRSAAAATSTGTRAGTTTWMVGTTERMRAGGGSAAVVTRMERRGAAKPQRLPCAQQERARMGTSSKGEVVGLARTTPICHDKWNALVWGIGADWKRCIHWRWQASRSAQVLYLAERRVELLVARASGGGGGPVVC
mmetsp:Transcript_18063/g.50568  ORF Transcript_18063/g.50568 Transcript_18063/m.50568 type:complete len:319 (-) Transcript_18063:1611-2567(-)